MSFQDLTFEGEVPAQLETMLRAAIAVGGYRSVKPLGGVPVQQYPSHAAAYLMRHVGTEPFELGWQPPDRRAKHYRAICALGRSGDLEPEALVAEAMALVRAADTRAFRAEGEGPFSGCDGSVGVGYRLHAGALGHDLLVSLCHFYHPK